MTKKEQIANSIGRIGVALALCLSGTLIWKDLNNGSTAYQNLADQILSSYFVLCAVSFPFLAVRHVMLYKTYFYMSRNACLLFLVIAAALLAFARIFTVSMIFLVNSSFAVFLVLLLVACVFFPLHISTTLEANKNKTRKSIAP